MPFKYCPACGSTEIRFENGKALICSACGHEYYHNVATAAGTLIEIGEKLVFIERAMDPCKGKLALPGGFVDPGERAEDAAIRECREEIGWAPDEVEFLASFPNTYRYAGVLYNTCDLFFIASFEDVNPEDFKPQEGEVSAIRLLSPSEIHPEDLAFESSRRAVEAYLRLRYRG